MTSLDFFLGQGTSILMPFPINLLGKLKIRTSSLPLFVHWHFGFVQRSSTELILPCPPARYAPYKVNFPAKLGARIGGQRKTLLFKGLLFARFFSGGYREGCGILEIPAFSIFLPAFPVFLPAFLEFLPAFSQNLPAFWEILPKCGRDSNV